MPTIVIQCTGVATQVDPRVAYPFIPIFEAIGDGAMVFKVDVRLAPFAADQFRLKLAGLLKEEDVDPYIRRAIALYGARRVESLCRGLSAETPQLEEPQTSWALMLENIPELIVLAATKTCDYQRTVSRDHFCTAASPSDRSATFQIDGRSAAPTSMPLCRACALPNTDYLCSMFSHAEVNSMSANDTIVGRRLIGGMCNAGQPGVTTGPEKCRAGGHDCWRRIIEVDEPAAPAYGSPTELSQAIDTLDAYWRLAFDKKNHLVEFHVTAEVSELTLPCTSREEFRSRMSALADVISKFKIGDELLPETLPNNPNENQKKASLNRLQWCLTDKLPDDLHTDILKAIGALRQIVDVRVALQHSGKDGGLAGALEKLGIRDAPPNWASAWDNIRSRAVVALATIRAQLGRYTT